MTRADAVASPVSWGALMTRARWIDVARIAATAVVALLYWREVVPIAALWASVAVGLWPLATQGVRALAREHLVGTELFVTIATLVAVVGGEPLAGAVLMTIILIAEFIAGLNTERARASIRSLVGSVPETAVVRRDGEDKRVAVTTLAVDDVVLVRAGEKIPVDGRVTRGSAAVDESPITGESIPSDRGIGDDVFAGTIVSEGALDITTARVGEATTFARIIRMVEEAQDSQAPVQRLADRVASWLIPVVFLFLAAVAAITWARDGAVDVRLIVTLLVFTSPAELGLATPLVIIAAISRAARNGVLVKGGVYLETLAKVDTIVFDKTGTLTQNRPRVTALEPVASHTQNDLLAAAASVDRRSAHPLAVAIVAEATRRELGLDEPQDFTQITARGARARLPGGDVLVGNRALLQESQVEVAQIPDRPGETAIHVAIDGRFAGFIYVADAVRESAASSLSELRARGVTRMVMLTGDNLATAQTIAARIGIDEVRANLLPADKVAAINELRATGAVVAMVGDGINDAPALAAANVGIAMGGSGSQAALEAADVALMADDLAKIVVAREIAYRAYRTIKENLIVGIGVVHVLGITAALAGWIGPIEAALLHLGPDIAVFLNSVKLVRVNIPGATR